MLDKFNVKESPVASVLGIGGGIGFFSYLGATGELSDYWIQTLSDSNNDFGYGIATDSSNNVYIVGYYLNSAAGDDEVLIAKYDSSGLLQWQKGLSNSASNSGDQGYGIAVDSSDNVYIVGENRQFGTERIFIVKYNSSGTIQWQRWLSGGVNLDSGRSIAIDSSDNVYITAITAYGVAPNDHFTAKYDSSGTLQWQRTLGDADNQNSPGGIAIDSSNNIYITNTTGGFGEPLIAKYNSSGTIQWQIQFSNTSNDYIDGIAVDSSDNIYITGYTDSDGAGNYDVLIAKFDSSGTPQWQRTIGDVNADFGSEIAIDSLDNVYVTSRYVTLEGTTANARAILIAKYNSSGVIQWQRTLDDSGNIDQAWDITIDSSDNICITGSTGTTGAYDVLIAKLPSDGSLTGAYGPFVYTESSLTEAAAVGFTTSTTSLTDQAASLTDAAGTLVDSVSTLEYDNKSLRTYNYWIQTLSGTVTEQAFGIAVDSSNNIYIVGDQYLNDGLIVAKYNSSGVIQWQRKLGTASNKATAITTDSLDNVYITGYFTTTDDKLVIAKYDSDGTLQWQKNFGSTTIDVRGFGIAADSSNNIYATGWYNSPNEFALVAKFDSSGTVIWQRLLNNGAVSGEDIGQAIAVDSSNNVYITGWTNNVGTTINDIFTAKYDSSGTLQWQRKLTGSGAEIGYGIATDSSNNVYIVGYTASDGAGSNDILIAKYNSSGTIQWQRTLGGINSDIGYGIAVDSSDNIYITGATGSDGAGLTDILIAKYNSSGVIQWQRTLGGTGNFDQGQGITVDSSNNICITGYFNNDFLITKLPSDGSLTGTYGSFSYTESLLTDAVAGLTDAVAGLTTGTSTLSISNSGYTEEASELAIDNIPVINTDYWIQTNGNAGVQDYLTGIAVDSSDNIYTAGRTASDGAGGNDIFVAKYNSSGAIQWQRTLGGSGGDFGEGIAVDSSSNVYVVGYTQVGNPFVIVKYNSSGTIQWQRTLTSSNSCQAYAVTVDSSNNLCITGWDNASIRQIQTVKYDSSGTLLWQRKINAPGAAEGYGVVTDSSNNIYIAGRTGSSDTFIAKYDLSGTLQWQKTLSGATVTGGYDIAIDSSNNLYITGVTNSALNILIVKYDSSGTLQWQRRLNGGGGDSGQGIAVDSLDNIYITGYTPQIFDANSSGDDNALIAKYDSSGTLQWQRVLKGYGNTQGNKIALDSSNNICIAGITNSGESSTTFYNHLIAKLPSDGSLTGAYGPFVYTESSLIDTVESLTDSAAGFSTATTTHTDAASSFTDAEAVISFNGIHVYTTTKPKG